MEGADVSTNKVALDDEGSGALDVRCTLGLRLPGFIMQDGSAYSSSEEHAKLEGATLDGISEVPFTWPEKLNDESVAWTSRHTGSSERRGARSKKLDGGWLGPASLDILVMIAKYTRGLG